MLPKKCVLPSEIGYVKCDLMCILSNFAGVYHYTKVQIGDIKIDQRVLIEPQPKSLKPHMRIH